MKFLPYGRQWIDEDDCLAVLQVLTSDWLTQGPKGRRIGDDSVAARCAARFGIACNSGTAALHMALAALDIGRGDVVVVPANTFLATANAAIYVGAEVRFADVDPNTGLMGPEQLTRALAESLHLRGPCGPSCRSILPGHHVTWPPSQVSSADRLPAAMLIEDACHAIGGKHAGSNAHRVLEMVCHDHLQFPSRQTYRRRRRWDGD